MLRLITVKRTLVVCGALLFMLTAPCHGQTSAKDALAAGLAATKSGDLTTAKNLLQQVVVQFSETPEAAKARWQLGMIALREKDRDGAKRWFKLIVDKYPTSFTAANSLFRLGCIAGSEGNPTEALGIFAQVVSQHPGVSRRLRRDVHMDIHETGGILRKSGGDGSARTPQRLGRCDGGWDDY